MTIQTYKCIIILKEEGVWMMKFNKFINAIRGRVHLDNSLNKDNSPILLHISDTPSGFYPELARIIKLIQPDYIIHTGDLADNIKTEFSPSLLTKYKYEVDKLLKILNSSSTENIYITIGNHDDYNFLDQNKGKLKIYNELGEISIKDRKYIFSHYWEYLKREEADIFLFGHDIEKETMITDSGIYLNGILSINIVNLDTLEVKTIKYPIGTNSARLKQHMIRI